MSSCSTLDFNSATVEVSSGLIFIRPDKLGYLISMSPYLFSISKGFYNAVSQGIDPLTINEFSREINLLKSLGYYPDGKIELSYKFFGIILNLLNSCNMACGYCCVGPAGSYNRTAVGRMTKETARKSIDFLVEHANGDFYELTFFWRRTSALQRPDRGCHNLCSWKR